MKHSRFRSLDDSGKPVRIFSAPTFDAWRQTGDPRLKDLLRRITFVLTERRFRVRELESVLFAAPAIAVMIAVWTGPLLPGIPIWLPAVAMPLLSLPFVHLAVRLNVARRAGELTRLMLEEGFCPVCGYNFYGLDAQNGMISCPECGAVWKSERIARALPVDETRKEHVVAKILRHPMELTTVGYDDDRGTRVAMADPRLRAARRGAGDSTRVAKLARAKADLAPIGRVRRLLLAIAMIALGVALGWILLSARMQGRMIPVFSLFGPVCLLGLGIGVWVGRLGFTPRRVREVMLSHALCASCAASLEGTPAEPDGCTICRECRAAWRLPSPGEAR